MSVSLNPISQPTQYPPNYRNQGDKAMFRKHKLRITIITVVALIGVFFFWPSPAGSDPAGPPYDTQEECENPSPSSVSGSSISGEYPPPEIGCYQCPDGTWIPTESTVRCDVCPDVPGHNETIPDGYELDEDGNCVPIEEPPPTCEEDPTQPSCKPDEPPTPPEPPKVDDNVVPKAPPAQPVVVQPRGITG